MGLGWIRGEDRAADLLTQVINNKRCRKKKSPNNVVNLTDRRIGVRAGNIPSAHNIAPSIEGLSQAQGDVRILAQR